MHVTLVDNNIDIPPGEKAFRTHDRCELPIDMEAVSIFPHMHMIGKDIKVTATFPDGTVQILLWIDDWDFNLQNIYEFAEPVLLPKGTVLSLEGIHDNSAENPRNPKIRPSACAGANSHSTKCRSPSSIRCRSGRATSLSWKRNSGNKRVRRTLRYVSSRRPSIQDAGFRNTPATISRSKTFDQSGPPAFDRDVRPSRRYRCRDLEER